MSAASHPRLELRRVSRSPARKRQRAASAPQLRWDRLARAALLCVLAALLYLYLSAGAHLFSTWQQERRDNGAVRALEREHEALVRQRANLLRRETVEIEARRLGMVKQGEQPYVISGLPGG
jgi:cell division protein FtsB